jgi:hypothetical protein
MCYVEFYSYLWRGFGFDGDMPPPLSSGLRGEERAARWENLNPALANTP